jgi:hypothetical protein
MAQTGYTPILIYSSSTTTNAPAVGNLTNSTLGSELAINITDGKLFYKDNANAIQVIGWKTTPTSAGGTGLTSYAAGDLLYYATGTTLSKLAIGASGRWLGSSGTAPQWNAPAALTKTDDTNVTLTLGGSASTALLNAASLTLGWTGTLATTRGGTGLSSFTANSLVYSTSTSALTTNTNIQTDGTSLKLQSVALFRGYAYSAGNLQTWLGNNLNESLNLQTTDTAQLFRMLTGVGFEWMDAPSGTGGTAASLTSRMTLGLSTGNLTLATGNLVIGTSGKGIDFSATPGTGTSELFADYEEGTWTPTLTDATNNATMGANNSGTYTKIGRVVTCSMYVETTSLGSIAAGAGIYISGWPYTIAKTGGGFLTSASGLNITANQVVVLSPWAGTLMRFYIWDATTGTSPLIASQWSADGASYISITYTV